MVSWISANELWAYIRDEVSPTIIDVRIPEAYERGHLPGAVNITHNQLTNSIDQIPTDHPIVIYCNMHQPGDSGSENAAEMLRDAGLHTRALEGGYPAWEEEGFPIDRIGHALPQNWTQQSSR
jgi:rhodanese-related sulfurtransferase